VEYLVTMTTNVPAGTSEETVNEVRAREAARARELAAAGHLLRLWRPPLAPGEWRTLGLFAADDTVELEKILASMPLRIWRSDEVTPLSPHPNDPPHRGPVPRGTPEFLTTFILAIPDGTAHEDVDAATARDALTARELAGQGHLIRLWALPERGSALGLWAARDAAQMRTIATSLPLSPWLTTRITPLTPHPSDPATTGRAEGK